MIRDSSTQRAISSRHLSLIALAVILGLALFFRTYKLDEVPPGVHHDEIINSEIALATERDGPQLFYQEGWGREGFYHLLLAGSLKLPLPVHWRLRLPSVVCSLVGVLLTWIWVRRRFGNLAAFTAAGGMAVTLWPVILGRAALRATTLLPLAAAAALVLEKMLSRKSSRTDLWCLGFLLGLTVYTYRAARVLPVVYLIFALYLLARRQSASRRLIWALAGTLLLVAPLVLALAANPGIEARIEQVDRPWQALLNGDFEPILRGAVATWGMFGWRGDPESHYNLPGRPVFEPIGAVLFLAGGFIALKRWRQPIYAFLLIWLVIGLAPGMVTEPVPHFVHTVLAQGVAFVFPGIAVAALSQRSNRVFRMAIRAAVIIWLAGNAVWTFSDYFFEWPKTSQVSAFHQSNLAAVARHLDQSSETSPVAICTGFLNETDPFWRTGRQTIPLLLNRHDLAIRWYSCDSAQVWPEGGEAARFFFLQDAGFPDWVPADWLTTARQIESSTVHGVSVDVADPLDAHLATLALPAPVNLGDQVLFLGYQPTEELAQPGAQMILSTYWRVLAPLPPDLGIFLHLLGDSATPLAQGDALALLSDTLQPGDIVVQRHGLVVPADVPAGVYSLSAGVYSRSNRHPRLTVMADGQEEVDHLILGQLVISD